MLMDMFADSLPHVSKKRWHYNNFMLSIYGHIHQISEQRRNSGETGSKLRLENDYILLELAERMIDQNTVLLLDEFMLPDMLVFCDILIHLHEIFACFSNKEFELSSVRPLRLFKHYLSSFSN